MCFIECLSSNGRHIHRSLICSQLTSNRCSTNCQLIYMYRLWVRVVLTDKQYLLTYGLSVGEDFGWWCWPTLPAENVVVKFNTYCSWQNNLIKGLLRVNCYIYHKLTCSSVELKINVGTYDISDNYFAKYLISLWKVGALSLIWILIMIIIQLIKGARSPNFR